MSFLLRSTVVVALFGMGTFCISCTKKSSENLMQNYPGVDSELHMYFANFEKAAADRGVVINLVAKGVTGEIDITRNNETVGQCQYNPTSGAPHIIIDRLFWEGASTLRKEKIVFHELGHCLLQREHDEEILATGMCKSIMRSGTGTCLDNYTAETRDYYLDELFKNE